MEVSIFKNMIETAKVLKILIQNVNSTLQNKLNQDKNYL